MSGCVGENAREGFGLTVPRLKEALGGVVVASEGEVNPACVGQPYYKRQLRAQIIKFLLLLEGWPARSVRDGPARVDGGQVGD